MRSLCYLLSVIPILEAAQIPFISPSHHQIKTFSHSHDASPLILSGHAKPSTSTPKRYPLSEVSLRSIKQKVWKPSAVGGSNEYMQARRASVRQSRGQPHPLDYVPMEWTEVEVDAPDVTDVDTLAGLAKMTANAYEDATHVGQGDWYNLTDGGWNLSDSFGWREDGIRGHVFAMADNSTIVVSIKGTSANYIVGGGGSTQINDKLNDNLLFSCCCARVDWSWSPVCDCYSGNWKCDETCVEDALIEKSVYYPLATDLYNNITRAYPNSQIWLTGHSLGGALASFLSHTFGVPCVTFESPGDLLPTRRLHLPLPPGQDPATYGAVTHVYHNADPIPQGACTGSLSTCGLVGFALESRCHSGQTILYDTVGELGWSVDVRTHPISQIIEKVLIPGWDAKPSTNWWKWPWGGTGKQPDKGKSHVPKARKEEGCFECTKWTYGDFKHSEDEL